MTEKIYKDKTWILGISVVIIGIVTEILFPDVFKIKEEILGLIIVAIGLIMIYQIIKK